MKVLLSIKPEFALKIFDGSKKYEYRRSIFKKREVETVVVYVSNPIRRVVGEFDIGEIHHKKPEQLWAQTCRHAGITRAKFMEYFSDLEKGYAIGIGKTRKYLRSLSLNDLKLTSPPQSFMYLYTDPTYYLYDCGGNYLSTYISLPAFASVQRTVTWKEGTFEGNLP